LITNEGRVTSVKETGGRGIASGIGRTPSVVEPEKC
jgi:hypothetical protein